MKINLDRLCKLAGVESDASAVLSESSNRSYHEEDNSDEVEFRYGGKGQLSEADHGDMDEEDYQHMHEMEGSAYEGEDDQQDEMLARIGEDLDEMIEIDEAVLVQEIRRARRMIAASASTRSTPEPEETLQEAQLRRIVAEEVDSVMKDLNLTSGWVYGNDKPTNSKRGVVNTAFPGIGFKN